MEIICKYLARFKRANVYPQKFLFSIQHFFIFYVYAFFRIVALFSTFFSQARNKKKLCNSEIENGKLSWLKNNELCRWFEMRVSRKFRLTMTKWRRPMRLYYDWTNAKKKIFAHHRPKQIGCFIQITKNFCFVPFHFLNLLPKKTCVDVHKIIYTVCMRNANKLVTNLVFPMKFWLLCREFHFTNKSADKKSRKKTLWQKAYLYRPCWWTNVNFRFSERTEKEAFLNLRMIFDWSKAMRLLQTLSFGYLLCIMTSMAISTAISKQKVYVANCLTKSSVEVIKNMKILRKVLSVQYPNGPFDLCSFTRFAYED